MGSTTLGNIRQYSEVSEGGCYLARRWPGGRLWPPYCRISVLFYVRRPRDLSRSQSASRKPQTWGGLFWRVASPTRSEWRPRVQRGMLLGVPSSESALFLSAAATNLWLWAGFYSRSEDEGCRPLHSTSRAWHTNGSTGDKEIQSPTSFNWEALEEGSWYRSVEFKKS